MSALDDWLLQDVSATGGAGPKAARSMFSQTSRTVNKSISLLSNEGCSYFNPINPVPYCYREGKVLPTPPASNPEDAGVFTSGPLSYLPKR